MRLQPVEYFRRLNSWQEIESVATLAQSGQVPADIGSRGPKVATRFKYDLLRWAVSEAPEAHAQWAALRRSQEPDLNDREKFALRLWRSLEGANSDLRGLLFDRMGLRDHLESHLFHWLLSRFNVAGARELVAPGRRHRLLQYATAIVILAAAVVAVDLENQGPGSSILAAAIALVALLSSWRLSALRPAFFVSSLIPRLAVGVAIGYLFLAAAPDLVRMILEFGEAQAPWWAWAAYWSVPGLLVLSTYGFAWLHIARRVQPQPSTGQLLGRGADLLALGSAYSGLGLALVSPLLFRPSFLLGPAVTELPGAGPGALQLVLTAAIALGLGVALQLAWEEGPLTEPL